jgi:hypothetical protein
MSCLTLFLLDQSGGHFLFGQTFPAMRLTTENDGVRRMAAYATAEPLKLMSAQHEDAPMSKPFYRYVKKPGTSFCFVPSSFSLKNP